MTAGPRPVAPDTTEILDSSTAGTATIRGGALRTAGYAAGVLLTLAAAPLLVRHLGLADFGRYMTVVSLVALAGGVSDAGLTSIGVREWSTGTGEERRRLMRDLLGLRLVLTVAGIAAVVGFAALAGYGGELVLGTALAGLGLLLLVVQQGYSVPLQAELRLGWVAAADVLRQVLLVAGIVALVVASAGLVAFLVVPIPSALGALVLTALAVRRARMLRPAFSPRAWKALTRDTLPVAAAVTLHHLYLRVVIVLMSLVATDQQTGFFAASYRVTEVLIAVPFLLAQATLPVLARAAGTDRERLAYAMSRVVEASVVLGAGAVLLMVAGAPLIVEVLVGDRGEAQVTAVLRLQSLVLLPVFLTVAWQNTLLALRRHGALVVSNAVGLAATVILVLVLVPHLGARGAALAALLGELALTATSALLLLRGARGVALSAPLLLRIGSAAALGAAVLAVPGLPVIVRALAVGVAYVGALLALRAVPPDLLAALRPARYTDAKLS